MDEFICNGYFDCVGVSFLAIIGVICIIGAPFVGWEVAKRLIGKDDEK
jgi:hypothetical protein